MGIITVLPALYMIAGATYGLLAIIHRLRLHLEFRKFTQEQKNVLRVPQAQSKLNGVQLASLAFSSTLLLSFILCLVGLVGHIDITWIGLAGITLLPPWVIGFNYASVWNQKQVLQEESNLAAKKPWTVAYYCALIPMWLIGVLGSYVGLTFYAVSITGIVP